MAASTKAQKEANGIIAIVAALILFIPFILVGFVRFSSLKNEYLHSESAIRIIDIAGIRNTLLTCSGYIFFSWMFLSLVFDGLRVLGIILVIPIIGVGILLGMRLSVVYLGAIIDDGKDIIIFPPDFHSFTISDYFTSKFFKAFYNVDEVNISKIFRITRQAGKDLFIHGDFGSRQLAFSSKQKRDECIATIQATNNYKGSMIKELEFTT